MRLPGLDGHIVILDAVAHLVVRTLTLPRGAERFDGAPGRNYLGFEQLQFSPDGRFLAGRLVSSESTVYVWNVSTGTQVRVFNNGQPAGAWDVHQFGGSGDYRHRVATFSPDSKLLAVGESVSPSMQKGKLVGGNFGGPPPGVPDEKRISIHELATGKELARFANQQHITALAFSRDGRTLVSGDSNGVIRLWETASWQERGVLRGHLAAIASLTFGPYGKTLASGSADMTALLWDTWPQLPRRVAGEERSEKELKQWWTDLAGQDATKAYRSLAELVRAPAQTVPLLKARLQDLPRKPTAEEQLQALRGLEALEHLGTAEARGLVESLANGPTEAWLTQPARAVRDRLRRTPDRP
jgi:hypothetical protein